MSIEYICDGCGKRKFQKDGIKPTRWFSRKIREKCKTILHLHACSKVCLDTVATKDNIIMDNIGVFG